MTIQEVLKAYVAARTKKDEANAAAKIANAAFKEQEHRLAEYLVEQGLRNATDDEGRMFSLRPSFWYSSGKDLAPRILDWLKSRGFDPSQYWKPKIEKKRLTETLKAVYEKEGKQVTLDNDAGVPKWFNLDTTPAISVRGWKEDDDDDE